MVALSESSPGYVIRPPLTAGDKGIPSKSILKDIERVFAFVDDERHLVAHQLYEDVVNRIRAWEQKQSSKNKHGKKFGLLRGGKDKDQEEETEQILKAKRVLESKHEAIELLENRCRIFRRAQRNLNVSEDWTYASHHFGITTHYRREENGSLSIKLEGEVSGVPLFEQIAVLRDVDNHYKWVPFCVSSMTVAQLDKLDIVGWFLTGVPLFGLVRDGCFRAIGCDNMSEDGSILIAGQGIRDRSPESPPPEDTFLCDDPIIDTLNIPPMPTKRGHGRMTIRKFETVVHVVSPTAAITRVVANIEPNIPFLSQTIIDFVMKHLAGLMLTKLQNAAKNAVKNPVTNHHAVKMREESAFYQTWLMAKFKAFCDERGWKMPTVNAFALNEEQVLHNARYTDSRRTRRSNTFGGIDEDVAEGDDLATFKSTPNLPTIIDDDAVSEITTRSNLSLWRNNPVSNFLRAKEEIVQQKKEAKIAEMRQRVAVMIKPKQLSFEQQERLAELKRAKLQRMGEGEAVSSVSSTGPEGGYKNATFLQRQAQRLHSHGLLTRSVVMSTLVALLSILLHPDLLLKDLLHTSCSSNSFWVEAMFDVGTTLYVLLCAAVHFLLCDIALVYAFGALDLGSKAGVQVKIYYGKNVRFGVAIMSSGILGFSFLKASFSVCSRVMLWFGSVFSLCMRNFISNDVTKGSSVHAGVVETCQLVQPAFVKRLEDSLTNWMSILFDRLPSAVMVCGLFLEAIESLLEVAALRLERFSGLIDRSFRLVDPLTGHRMWRENFFETAEFLFSYSAVFLVIVLLLFTFAARSVRPDTPADDKTHRTVDDASSSSLGRSSSGVSGMKSQSKASTPVSAKGTANLNRPKLSRDLQTAQSLSIHSEKKSRFKNEKKTGPGTSPHTVTTSRSFS